MDLWRNRYDDTSLSHKHVVAGDWGHAALAVATAFTYRALGVPASIWNGNLWWPIFTNGNVTRFEEEHGKDVARARYNVRKRAQLLRTRDVVRGEHAGYSDLFQPIVVGGKVAAILVVGPFARARPTSADIQQRWRALTGRMAHPSDPEFASYLQATLEILVLDGKKAARFERLTACFARLLAENGRADDITNEADVLRAELEQERMPERSWNAVRTMVDERSPRTWQSGGKAWSLRFLGLSRLPDHVAVGLTASREPVHDPVEEALRRDAFQRASFELARSMTDVISGRVGNHGVVFLSATSGSAQRKRQRLVDVAERAALLSRDRFGLSVHFGACVASGSAPLSQSYQAALGAAQSALTQRARIVFAGTDANKPAYSLRHLHQELARIVLEKPALLGARFDHYLEVVALHCGYRIEAAQAHLEVGFERMAEPLLNAGLLDQKGFIALREALDRGASEADTIDDLFEVHRRAAADLQKPRRAPRPRDKNAACVGQWTTSNNTTRRR